MQELEEVKIQEDLEHLEMKLRASKLRADRADVNMIASGCHKKIEYSSHSLSTKILVC